MDQSWIVRVQTSRVKTWLCDRSFGPPRPAENALALVMGQHDLTVVNCGGADQTAQPQLHDRRPCEFTFQLVVGGLKI